MIQLRRITQVNDPDLSRLMDLYELSFPEEERRDRQQLFRMIELVPDMSFNAVEDNGELCGLTIYWDLGDFYYMEHLAVFPEMRNRKIGQQILDYWKKHLPKLQVLEVEPAIEAMAVRRIGFYERNGFRVICKDYVQPSYRKDEDSCPLWIMGTDMPDDMQACIQNIKTNVYKETLKWL